VFKVLLIMLCRPNYVSISCTFTDIVRANIVDLEIRVGVVPGHCLSNAMHGQIINLRVSVCPSHFLSTRLQVRPLNGFLQLIA